MEAVKPSDPTKIGPYTVMGVIGRGGMGIVYYCKDGSTPVALKVINPNLNYDLEARRRFRREIAAAKKVKGRSVAKVVNEGSDQGMLWYASELVEGMTLQQAVAFDRFNGDAFFDLVRGLCGSLREIHSSGIVHRDLKPTNIMVGPRGVVVLDFGISHIVGGTAITATGEIIGTANYMSPEHFGIGEVGPASDIFALGCVLTFAATGRPAFGNHQTMVTAMRAILDDQPDLRGITGQARKIIELCLQKDSVKRVTLDQIEALLPAAKTVVLGNAEWLPPTVRQQVLAPTKVYPKPKTTRVMPGPKSTAPANPERPKDKASASVAKSSHKIRMIIVPTLALIAVCLCWFVFRTGVWQQYGASELLSSLPQIKFEASELGQINTGSGKTIAVKTAESSGYGLLLEVSFKGYDVPGATAAANALCAGAAYYGEDDFLKSKGRIPSSSSATDMNNGEVLADVVFDGVLLISSPIFLSGSCGDFAKPLKVGYNTLLPAKQNIIVLTNQEHVVPVMVVDSETFVVPSGADGYYYKKIFDTKGRNDIVVSKKVATGKKGGVNFDVYRVESTNVSSMGICIKDGANVDGLASCNATKIISMEFNNK